MALISKKDTRDIIFGGLSNPSGMIEAANTNVHNIMPRIDISGLGSSKLGIIESGNVDLETSSNVSPITADREEPLTSPMQLRKKRKGKNTHTTKCKRGVK